MSLKWGLVILVAICNTAGDVLNADGMRHYGEISDFRPASLLRILPSILHNRYLLGGFAAMTISFLAFLSLLSIANVSFAVPATASSYLFETILAKYFLKEDVGARRWIAAVLVAIGVTLLEF